jgi:predicted metal-dependent phosphoesterase TrpH
MLSDFHLHTCVSDGEMAPGALVARAAAHGIGHLAITDHDSLGAYRWGDGQVFEQARELGVELTVGTELDAVVDGREVHLLGYDVDLSAARLGAHLEEARRVREERARRELALVRERLGEGALREEEVFVPGRETLMRAHLIRPLVERSHFDSYEEGQDWFEEHVRAEVIVPKPSLGDAVAMIHAAGGWAALAHPGYYWKDGFPVLERLPALRGLGLDAVELDYPYRSTSPALFSPEDEREFLASLRVAGEALGLRFTRGSDAHRAADLNRVYGPVSRPPIAG